MMEDKDFLKGEKLFDKFCDSVEAFIRFQNDMFGLSEDEAMKVLKDELENFKLDLD